MKKIMVHVVAALVVALMLALTSLHAEQNGLQFEIMDKDRAVSSEENTTVLRQEPGPNKQVNRDSKVQLLPQVTPVVE